MRQSVWVCICILSVSWDALQQRSKVVAILSIPNTASEQYGSATREIKGKYICTTLVDLQLDVQNSYLFTYNTFIKIPYVFRALSCSSSGCLRRNCIYAASGIVTLCGWLSCAPVKKELFLNRCTKQSPAESYDSRGCNSFLTGAQDSHL